MALVKVLLYGNRLLIVVLCIRDTVTDLFSYVRYNYKLSY